MRLSEVETTDTHLFDQVTQRIEQQCGQALSTYREKQALLYRGSKGKADIFKSAPRPDRLPKDSSLEGQLIYDEYLRRKGIAAQRHNSIFTTPKRAHAQAYGPLYAVFPVDGFNFCWSQTNDDLVFREYHVEKSIDLEKIVQLIKVPTKFQYDWDFKQTIQSNIRASGQNVSLFDMINWEHIEDKYAATDQNFPQALTMGKMVGHEVMISATYYGIRYDTYRAALEGWLGFKI